MFEDLKRTEAAGLGAAERSRLSWFVILCLVLGASLLSVQNCSGPDDPKPPTDADAADGADEGTEAAPDIDIAPTVLDAEELKRLGSRDVGGGVRSATVDAYADDVIQYMRTTVEGHPVSGVRLTPTVFQASSIEEPFGGVFEIEGQIVEQSEQYFGSEAQRIWSVVLQDADGGQTIAITHGLSSDGRQGRPVDDYQATGSRQEFEVGQRVAVRGYYIQRRTGTIGSVTIPQSAPVLWATNWRAKRAGARRLQPVDALADIDWSDVKDRYLSETREWWSSELRMTLAWAQRTGSERIAEMIHDGTIEVQTWDQAVFSEWQAEVDVRKDDAERPFTEGARGTWFRTRGLLANEVYMGWSDLEHNNDGVDHCTTLDILSDHYGNLVVRSVAAFPAAHHAGVTGERQEHVWLYGVFYKNHTYQPTNKTRRGETKSLITMPMFVVMHIEQIPPSGDTASYAAFMWWVVGSIFVLGLLFWLVIVRGDKREAARHSEQRLRLRRQRRAKEGGEQAPMDAQAPPTDAEPGALGDD